MKALAMDVGSRFLSDEQVAARIQSVADAHYFAERRVPKGIFQLFEAGSGSNVTTRETLRTNGCRNPESASSSSPYRSTIHRIANARM